jgi:hypothetical protein
MSSTIPNIGLLVPGVQSPFQILKLFVIKLPGKDFESALGINEEF